MQHHSPLAIYVHWPWCKAKCPYCDFNSHASKIYEEPYINGLLQEIGAWHQGQTLNGQEIEPMTAASRRIESIFFGGGTPSLMAPGNLAKIIARCGKLGLLDNTTEVSVECNPTSFDDTRKAFDFFGDLKAAGVNRVSIGVQGLKPEWLRFLGREHQVDDALATLDAAQHIFDNVNADVIYGLPMQQVEDWAEQLETLAGRGLAHISAYQLTIEKNTRFFKDVQRGLLEPISSDAEADFFEATREVLGAAGYENYEISNFAQPGKACRHNLHVWRYGDYLGIGAGAHGRLTTTGGKVIATQVIRQPDSYLRRIESCSGTLSQAVTLCGAEAVQEAVFSGLRLAEGIFPDALQKRFGNPSYKEAISASETASLVEATLLEWHNDHLRLTRAGWPCLNGILQRVLATLPTPYPPTPTLSTPGNNAYD